MGLTSQFDLGWRTYWSPPKLADITAKAATEEALQQNLNQTMSYTEAKSYIRKAINKHWQESWNRANVSVIYISTDHLVDPTAHFTPSPGKTNSTGFF